jgi:asparagine synthetase B (glutamine-hydrolysing)
MLITSEKYRNKSANEKPVTIGNIYFYENECVKISDKIYFKGEIDYVTRNEERVKFKGDLSEALKAIESENAQKIYDNIEGSYFFIKINNDNISLYTDRYCKKDIFYFKDGKDFVVSDSLEYFFKAGLVEGFDRVSLVSFFTLYGNYVPKKQTLYKNIFRLGVNQSALITNQGINISETAFKLLETEKYNSDNLEEYYKIFSDSIKSRSSESGINWIYLSSGWDSTSILGMLKEFYPSEQIRGVIGEMVYSERSGVINKFEVDRAKAIAEYYKIKLDIVPLDYTRKEITDSMQSVIPFMKNNLINSFNTFNFFILSDFIGKYSAKEDVVFSGEISDGVHNLGFSQYATILDHPDLGFREYADKMASYLFGPAFLNSVLENNYEKDIVYNFLKNRYGGSKFYSVLNEKDNVKNKEMLSSFFLSPRRIPFYSIENLSLFNTKAANEYRFFYIEKYFEEYGSKMNASNIYSIIIHLYNSFHWQGSTVKVIGKSLERFGKDIKLPFWDKSIQEFLSRMPEDWGRGLDFNKTKYPLKWMLENKIDYPMHLQKGPHSYLYDVNPGFSHLAEVLYGKRLFEYFKNILKEKKFEKYLDGDFFNLDYVSGIQKDYMGGTELSGQKLNDVCSLILLSLIID